MRGRYGGRGPRGAAVALAAVLLAAAGPAVPAHAAPSAPPKPAHPGAPGAADPHVHRGVNGCFAWSWGDDWLWEATVYFHNRCAQPHRLRIAWKSKAVRTSVITVPADGKGRESRMTDPLEIYDAGRA
ncbi:hypothetical protein [Kitasatospora cinereorecta]|uniref:Uncharacterized protein n=1 Tax=Kitasatospora cinereorecta TaxID=285560 RepID=A0ABW0VJY7_9ACTN